MHPTYLRYELLRNLRNWRLILFSLAYPVVLYFIVTTAQRHARFDGVAFPLYFMAGMAAVGRRFLVAVGPARGSRPSTGSPSGWRRRRRWPRRGMA